MLKYNEVTEMSPTQIESELATRIPHRVINAVLSASMFERDLDWAQDIAIGHADEDNPAEVRAIAIQALGHIARIYGAVDVERVLPVLEKALADKDRRIAAQAETALDDLRQFDPEFRVRWDQLHALP